MAKSIRLNKSIRKSIVASLLDSWVVANPEIEGNPLLDYCLELSNKFVESLPKDILKNYKDFIYHTKGTRVNLEGESRYVHFGEEEIPFQSKYPVLTNKKWLTRILNHEAKVNEREDRLRKFEMEVTSIVDSCNTTGQLTTVWPEIEEHLPQYIGDPSKINLPAIRTDVLNSQLKGK